MKAKYKHSFHSPNGKVSNSNEYLGTSPAFWAKEAKLAAKDGTKMSYSTKVVNGKPIVTSVRFDYKDKGFLVTRLNDTKQLNKTVSRGKKTSRKYK